MAKVNYRLQKRQREEARKKTQLEKQAKRGRVPEATPGEPASEAASAAGSETATAPEAPAGDLPKA